MKTIIYNKLIRDKIPEIIENSGKTCKTRVLEDSEYKEHLKLKLKEELQEYLESESIEELADLTEVINAILNLEKITSDEFQEILDKKATKRGRFKKRLLLIEVVEEG